LEIIAAEKNKSATTETKYVVTHLDLINCITTFSDAILPILPKIA